MLQNSENYNEYINYEELIEYFVKQYGFSKYIFDDYKFYQISKTKIIYMVQKFNISFSNITQIGLSVYKGDFPNGYPTNAFLYRFGKYATKNIISIEIDNLPILLDREGIKYFPNHPTFGPQILKTENNIIGRGWTRDGLLYLDAQKIWKQNLT